MARTPEGRVKVMIRKRLLAAGFVQVGDGIRHYQWFYMPVQGPLSVHGVHDFVGMDRGISWSIEAKSERGTMTDHQRDYMRLVQCAGGVSVEVRTEADMDVFFALLEERHGRKVYGVC
jgi:hypothetical protein